MVIKWLLLGSCFMIACSCNNANQKSESSKDTVSDAAQIVPAVAVVQCYENQNGPDTLKLKLSDSSGFVAGNLDYHISGKDANKGSFKGRMYGDTLIAEYAFRSEGVRSVRQIAFLKKDSFLIEGFGPVKEEQKQMKFKSMDSLSFNEVNRLILVTCK